MSMKSYKIHSIKNNKKLSFIIEGEDSERIKENLSADGFIVLTIEELQEEKNKTPRFVFEALKENKSRVEWKVDALDIFSAYEILRNDYQYTVLRLYPIDVTDPKEQENIFKNILQIFPQEAKKEKEVVKSKSFTEVDILKGYLDILGPLVSKSGLPNKEILLYDIKRVDMINSISSIQEVIKKTVKALYYKGSIEDKKAIYKDITPIAKHLSMIIFPPFIFSIALTVHDILWMIKVIFWSTEKKDAQKSKKTTLSKIKILQKDDTPEKKIYTNKNIFILLKKKYRSSWLDIFKIEGSYFYTYSLLRQNRSLFLLKILQQYIGMTALYTCFFFIFWVIIIWWILTPEFLFFNEFVFLIMSMIFLSLVFFFKEI